MRKHIRLFQTLAFFGMLFLYNFANAQPAKNGLTVSVEEVQEDLDYLSSDELSGRETGTEGIEKAAKFIEDHFREVGLRPYFETYRDSFQVGDDAAYNLVGLLEGTDEELKNEYIIIGAHYDHIGSAKAVEGDEIANGANDNAAGTVGVMHLAKQLAEAGNSKRSILFVLFSAEEKGLKGSEHLAEKLKEQGLDLYTMINLEMIGVPMKAKDYLAYITGFEKSNLAGKFNEYSNGEKVLGFLPQAEQMNLFKRSDNYPFYKEFKVPAQTICTFDFSNYPYYHHVDDEAEYLDAKFMASLIEELVPGLSKMANTPTKEIKMNE
ncbi:M28 family peptidase [Pontixanthobacter gangjinensis]|uniref:M20/M25/M40 family metallo-hydrolase n=1 Tax=Christiangramia aestuarii TaxID=1028746 RepID=A0A7M3SYN7_9FLAO|nr:M20/M25/M40 family metallo-hydrolase [Christiangramia aestuarii]MUP41718.1 M20/M25/M40 family metallo-hydrolase [Christiangramia aestuarii]